MMSFYEMTQQYKKLFKTSWKEGEDRYKFCETHPGYEFSYLMKLKHPTIPRIALPKEKLCPLEDLQLNTTKPTEESFDKCEIYEKKHYWCSIHLDLWLTSPLKEATGKKSLRSYKGILNVRSPNFQKKDFRILQNINDRMTLQKQLKRDNDAIYMTTKIENPNGKNPKKTVKKMIMIQTSSKWD
jgi:hypothetical protein